MSNTYEAQKSKGNKPIGCYISADLHKRLKLSCAAKDETIQDRLTRLIEEDLKNEK